VEVSEADVVTLREMMSCFYDNDKNSKCRQKKRPLLIAGTLEMYNTTLEHFQRHLGWDGEYQFLMNNITGGAQLDNMNTDEDFYLQKIPGKVKPSGVPQRILDAIKKNNQLDQILYDAVTADLKRAAVEQGYLEKKLSFRDSSTYVALQSMINDVSRLSIGPSNIHGLGLKAAKPIKKGELVGLQWYHYTPPHPVAKKTHQSMSFYPSECNLVSCKHLATCDRSERQTVTLPPEALMGCFPRFVNNECVGSTELFYKEVPIENVCDDSSSRGDVKDNECVPKEIAVDLKRKSGTKLYGAYLKAKKDLAVGDEITYNYLSRPDYIYKDPHVTQECKRKGAHASGPFPMPPD